MITSEQLLHLNILYWFKDSFIHKEIQKEYLEKLKYLADSMEAGGLVKEIEDYLLILK